MKRILTFTIAALLLSAPALAQTAPDQRKMYTEKPIGEGDPSATSCYPLVSSGSHIRKLDCRPNSEWAQIYAGDRATQIRSIGKPVEGPVYRVH